jgi:hypothetical protein
MTFYSAPDIDLTLSLDEEGQRNGKSIFQSYPHIFSHGINMVDPPYLQNNTSFAPLIASVSAFPAGYHDGSSPEAPLSNSHSKPVFPFFVKDSAVVNPSAQGPPFVSTGLLYPSSTQPTSSPSIPDPSLISTIAPPATAVVAPVTSTSLRAKFPCVSCGKICTSRPGADTCFNNHIGAKPFACNGICGREGW